MSQFDKFYWQEVLTNQISIIDLNERLCNASTEREKNETKPLLEKDLDQAWGYIREISSINFRDRPKEKEINFLKIMANYCQEYVDIERRNFGVNGKDYKLRVALASSAKTLWVRTCLKEGQLNFSGQDMRRVTLSGLSMREVNFSGANMCGANFSRSDLSGANFSKTNLTKSNFEESKLIYVNFEGAGLSRANLLNADLSGANLESANTKGAIIDKNTLIRLLNQPKRERFELEEDTFRDR